MDQEFLKLIKPAEKILITSHISPDPDALASALLMGSTLGLNFKEKVIKVVLEEEPVGLRFMPGYELAKFGPVYESIKEFEPDLLILLDGNNYERMSRHDGHKIKAYVKSHDVKTVIIDHHELAGKEDVLIFINNQSSATVQDVYDLCFTKLHLEKPAGAAQLAMIGFYADSGALVYVKQGTEDKIFGFARTLVSEGASIEDTKNQLEQYTEDDMRVLSDLMSNISHEGDYSYSYLSDPFIREWLERGNTQLQLQRPTNAFVNSYIRNIEGRKWGFIVYMNTLQGDNIYSASFRSQAGVPDVARIAASLGGGGHKPAAGAKFKAASVEDALEHVKAAIASS